MVRRRWKPWAPRRRVQWANRRVKGARNAQHRVRRPHPVRVGVNTTRQEKGRLADSSLLTAYCSLLTAYCDGGTKHTHHCGTHLCAAHMERVSCEGCPSRRPTAPVNDGRATPGTVRPSPSSQGQAEAPEEGHGVTGGGRRVEDIITEINTEINRHTARGQETRVWSAQEPVICLNWAQVLRWNEEMQGRHLGVCALAELNGAVGKTPRAVQEFRRACNADFAFQRLDYLATWSATLYRPVDPLHLPQILEGLRAWSSSSWGRHDTRGPTTLPCDSAPLIAGHSRGGDRGIRGHADHAGGDRPARRCTPRRWWQMIRRRPTGRSC